MQLFKVIFPAGYQIEDIFDDNIDINVVCENTKVYFGTLFTLLNIKKLMSRENDIYFWATNMVVLNDLKKETIKEAISQIINDGYMDQMFFEIGTIQTIFTNTQSFEELIDMV
jgi:hypothetical protein